MAETLVATLPLWLFWAVPGCGLPESSFLICKMKRVTRESSKILSTPTSHASAIRTLGCCRVAPLLELRTVHGRT